MELSTESTKSGDCGIITGSHHSPRENGAFYGAAILDRQRPGLKRAIVNKTASITCSRAFLVYFVVILQFVTLIFRAR